MRRRSRASSKPAKARSRKAKTLKPVRHSTSSASGQKTEVARLTCELNEAREQQKATAEILRVIRTSPADVQPVFETIVRNAVSLCSSLYANVFRFDGELLHFVAVHPSVRRLKNWRQYVDLLKAKYPIRPDASQVAGRVLLTKSVVRLEDAQTDPDYDQRLAKAIGFRRLLGVPMLRKGDLLGVIVAGWAEAGPVPKVQEELLKTFADQAAIAIENVRLFEAEQQRTRELSESLEQQTATSEVLRVISSSPGELEPVFQAMLANAVRICDAKFGNLLLCEADGFRRVADLIVASGTEKQLESHRREITALFCDLRGFTGFSESSDPEDVMALLAEYHAAIGKIINKYSGTLERYAGDGVMVVFNDPVPVENPALQAVLMALEMRDAIGALTETWHRWGHDIGFGIGIAHGFATLGTIGFEGRFDYAAIGTVSNVASRLCDEAKPGQILISPRVLTKVEKAVTVEPVGEFALKGIRRPMMAYNVLESTPSKLN